LYHELSSFFLPKDLGVYLDYGCGNMAMLRSFVGPYTQAHGVDFVATGVTVPLNVYFHLMAVGKHCYSKMDSLTRFLL